MTHADDGAPSISGTDALFRPLRIGSMTLPNRIVMAPMTRAFSPGGVPGPDVAAYYRRRAEGGAGLIITEGAWIPHAAASNDPNVPRFYGDDALAGWSEVLEAVHGAGGRIAPQLWHIGIAPKSDVAEIYADGGPLDQDQVGPSGLVRDGQPSGRAMTSSEIEDVAEAYVKAAETAFRMGFDGVELHAAHGYLLDQFFWPETNRRDDAYGGSIEGRNRLAVDIVKSIRSRTSPDFPIILRFSQWKMQAYDARVWSSPLDLETFLSPLVDAGVDAFHCSQRRFWLPEFEGSSMNLAGWTKKVSGRPTITVGSVTLSNEMIATLMEGAHAGVSDLEELLARLGHDEFDMVAVGRAFITNPDWPEKIKRGDLQALNPFSVAALASLH